MASKASLSESEHPILETLTLSIASIAVSFPTNLIRQKMPVWWLVRSLSCNGNMVSWTIREGRGRGIMSVELGSCYGTHEGKRKKSTHSIKM